jgi:hypothetical protein
MASIYLVCRDAREGACSREFERFPGLGYTAGHRVRLG